MKRGSRGGQKNFGPAFPKRKKGDISYGNERKKGGKTTKGEKKEMWARLARSFIKKAKESQERDGSSKGVNSDLEKTLSEAPCVRKNYKLDIGEEGHQEFRTV